MIARPSPTGSSTTAAVPASSSTPSARPDTPKLELDAAWNEAAAYPAPGRMTSSSSYIIQSVAPMPTASGPPVSTLIRTSEPGMLVCEAPSATVDTPARAAISAPPCQPTYLPPAIVHARSAFLPFAPSAWSP
jgi:hypothetical protein